MERIKPLWMGVLIAFLAINTATCATESQMRTPMNFQHMTLWQLIEALIEHPSFTLETIGQVLPIEFSKRGDNGYSAFYEGGPLRLRDQVVVKRASLAIRHKSGESRLIGLDLDLGGTCVTPDDVEAHYPDIDITGNFVGKTTYWSTRLFWGEMVFGLEGDKPYCLTHVGIERNIRRNDPPSS